MGPGHDPLGGDTPETGLLLDSLTVVRGSAQTLLALDLDEELRRRLLSAIVSASLDLERVLKPAPGARPEGRF